MQKYRKIYMCRSRAGDVCSQMSYRDCEKIGFVAYTKAGRRTTSDSATVNGRTASDVLREVCVAFETLVTSGTFSRKCRAVLVTSVCSSG